MRGRPWRTALSLLLCAGVWVGSASAAGVYRRHQRQVPVLDAEVQVSPWAAEEVGRAVALGLCPWEVENLPPDLRAAADRRMCCALAARLMAFQQNCDYEEFNAVVLSCRGGDGGEAPEKSVFSDLRWAGEVDAMYYMGVAKGRGDGTFDPEGTLTRQEAAVFLARAYMAYGGELPESANGNAFSDGAEIADWARDSVTAMFEAGIMQGYEDGRFAPGDPYTYEQCVISLLRLCENMPVSRKNGNVKTLFAYEQYLSMIEDEDNWLRTKWRVEGPVADFIKQIDPTPNSIPTVLTWYRFVYRAGGIREVEDLGVCSSTTGELDYFIEPENSRFSDDGKTLLFDITLPWNNDAYVYDPTAPDGLALEHSHPAGVYHIEIDVETCQVRTVTRDE